jgi:aryl-alcohol dehydrogenase-like predicted oxidoreductase
MGHNELLLRDALRGRDRARVVISVKFGALRDPKGNGSASTGAPPR